MLTAYTYMYLYEHAYLISSLTHYIHTHTHWPWLQAHVLKILLPGDFPIPVQLLLLSLLQLLLPC